MPYLFYEWEEIDQIETLKKVAIVKVNSQMMEDLITNKIKLEEAFFKQKNINNIILFSDGSSAVAIEFTDNGISLYKSFLELEQMVEVNDICLQMKKHNFTYQLLNPENIQYECRYQRQMKKFILTKINDAYNLGAIEELKYYYYELFNRSCSNKSQIYNKLIAKITEGVEKDITKLYDLIKITIKEV